MHGLKNDMDYTHFYIRTTFLVRVWFLAFWKLWGKIMLIFARKIRTMRVNWFLYLLILAYFRLFWLIFGLFWHILAFFQLILAYLELMVLIFTVVLITTRNKHQLTIGGPVVFTKCPFSDMSVGRNVRWARLPLAELSVRRNIHYTNCPLCELSVGQSVC